MITAIAVAIAGRGAASTGVTGILMKSEGIVTAAVAHDEPVAF
jgi:hypothetical protein